MSGTAHHCFWCEMGLGENSKTEIPSNPIIPVHQLRVPSFFPFVKCRKEWPCLLTEEFTIFFYVFKFFSGFFKQFTSLMQPDRLCLNLLGEANVS